MTRTLSLLLKFIDNGSVVIAIRHAWKTMTTPSWFKLVTKSLP